MRTALLRSCIPGGSLPGSVLRSQIYDADEGGRLARLTTIFRALTDTRQTKGLDAIYRDNPISVASFASNGAEHPQFPFAHRERNRLPVRCCLGNRRKSRKRRRPWVSEKRSSLTRRHLLRFFFSATPSHLSSLPAGGLFESSLAEYRKLQQSSPCLPKASLASAMKYLYRKDERPNVIIRSDG